MVNQYRVKGAVFENEKPNGPAFTGFIEIDGEKIYLALWPKTSQAGKNYFQFSEDKKKQQAGPQAAPVARSPFARKQQQAPTKKDDPNDDPFDDSIPF